MPCGRGQPMTNFLDIALQHIARGWYVFPQKPKDKKPLIPKAAGGRGFYDATLDADQVKAWWSKYPTANVGIACGASDLYVVDVDHGLTSEEDFHAWRMRNNLPVTYTVRTGRRTSYALQMYYRGAVECNGKWELDGCSGEIRSAGGLVMSAGNIHPDTGETYQLLVEAPLAPRPAILERAVQQAKVERPTTPAEPLPMLGKGEGRHPLMMVKLGKAHQAGFSEPEAVGILMALNAERFSDPIPEDEIEETVRSCYAKWAPPTTVPTVTIGETDVQPDMAELPKPRKPVYPFSAWEGTIVAEFAKLCTADNNIPRKMFAEAFRCCLGAVIGDRLSSSVADGAVPRTYTIVILPKGKGKGTCIRLAVRFFMQNWRSAWMSITPGLLSGQRDFVWKPKGVGAWIASASSVPGMARLTKELDATIKNKPHLTWGNTLPRVLSVHEEMKTFLSTLFIEGGVGSGMEGVVCQLWDDVSFHGTATGTRDAVYGEMMFSLLAGVTEEDWFDLLSRGNVVGGGLMSRLNLIGSEGKYENVAKIKPVDFTALQETFLPRIMRLEDAHINIPESPEAAQIVAEWVDGLPEGTERLNMHVWRSALLIAWLRHEETISAKTAEDAVSLGQYQLDSHEYYRVEAANNTNAKVQGKIRRALKMQGPLSKRDIQRYTNAHRDGTDTWSRAFDGLVRDKAVGRTDDGKFYLAKDAETEDTP